MSRIAVVDEHDRFVRWSDRAEIHRDKLLHRSIHVMLMDSAGRMVIQRRHPDKLTWPDCWDIAVSGHVEEEDYLGGPDERLDEVYARVAAREAVEELGVAPALEFVGHFGPVPDVHYEQIHLYRGVHDGPYRPQPEEVSEVRAVDAAGWERLAARGRVTASLRWFVSRLRPWR
jgi:isopentenyldiphosphate isomerase